MIDLIPYILILLALSAISMLFIVRVLLNQVRLFKYRITDKNISHFRNVLFAISITIIATGSIPIIINIVTLFDEVGRPDTIGFVSLIYSVSVHMQTFFLSYLLWRIYRLAKGDFNDKDK